MREQMIQIPIVLVSLLSIPAFAESIIVEGNSPILNGGALSENIGLETLGGVLTPLLNVGCKLPCKISQVFSTAADNQKQITITLARGVHKKVSSGTNLGKYRIYGIAPAPRGVPQIEVKIEAANGNIVLSASDKNSKIRLEKVD